MALRPTLDFLKTEAGGGAALIAAAILALVLANSPWSADYFALVHHESSIVLGGFSETLTLQAWVKDGLMAVFFFVVGLEIKQEVLKGELSSPRKVALPVIAALGGMTGPALVYLAINMGPGGAHADHRRHRRRLAPLSRRGRGRPGVRGTEAAGPEGRLNYAKAAFKADAASAIAGRTTGATFDIE